LIYQENNGATAGNKTVPFGSSDTRFEMRIFQEIKPSPGQYDPRNTVKDYFQTKGKEIKDNFV